MRIMQEPPIGAFDDSDWMNEQPLSSDEVKKSGYSEENFPIIDDFEVVLEKMDTPGWKGSRYRVLFFSQEKGYILVGSDWLEYDLCQEDFHIPVAWGYTDQNIELIVYESGNFVFITESDPDYPEKGAFRYYKVPSERYRAEWKEAIATCRNINLTDPMREKRTIKKTWNAMNHAIYMRLPPGSRIATLHARMASFPFRMYLKVYGWKFNREQQRKREAKLDE